MSFSHRSFYRGKHGCLRSYRGHFLHSPRRLKAAVAQISKKLSRAMKEIGSPGDYEVSG
jgi:hypothetical protein